MGNRVDLILKHNNEPSACAYYLHWHGEFGKAKAATRLALEGWTLDAHQDGRDLTAVRDNGQRVTVYKVYEYVTQPIEARVAKHNNDGTSSLVNQTAVGDFTVELRGTSLPDDVKAAVFAKYGEKLGVGGVC